MAASSKPAPISAALTGMMSASKVESVAVNTPSAPSAITKNSTFSALGVQRPRAGAGASATVWRNCGSVRASGTAARPTRP